MATSDVELMLRAWEAFSRGEIDAATEVLGPHLRWYETGDPDAEGSCHNREEALALAAAGQPAG